MAAMMEDSKDSNESALEGLFSEGEGDINVKQNTEESAEDDFGIFETEPEEISQPRASTTEPSDNNETHPSDISSRGRSSKTLTELKIKTIDLGAPPQFPAGQIGLIKLPTFMGVQGMPYSEEQLLSEELVGVSDIDDQAATAAKKATLLKAATTVRWRHNSAKVESNTYLIQWSDGSMSLRVGGELFEVAKQPMSGEYCYVYGRHQEAGCMESVDRLSMRYTIRPYIIPGSQAHRRYLSATLSDVANTATSGGSTTASGAGSSAATAPTMTNIVTETRVKMAVTLTDPEREKQRLVKLEQEKIRERRKIEARRRHLQQRSYERVSRSGLSARFLEEDEEEEDESQSASTTRRERESDDEEDEEDEDEYEEDFIDDTNLDKSSSEGSSSSSETAKESGESEAQFSDATDDDKREGSSAQPKLDEKDRVVGNHSNDENRDILDGTREKRRKKAHHTTRDDL